MKLIIVLIALFMPVTALAVSNQANSSSNNANAAQSKATSPAATATATAQQSQVVPELPIQAKNQLSKDRGNNVSQAVHDLILTSTQITEKGIGDQVRLIAQAQAQDANTINEAIDKADQRSSFTKFFLGPNYRELKKAKELRNKNTAEIYQLLDLEGLLTDEPNESILNNAIATLQAENSSLGGQIDILASGFSLFGWLNKLIVKY